jgi:hypothetical protein
MRERDLKKRRNFNEAISSFRAESENASPEMRFSFSISDRFPSGRNGGIIFPERLNGFSKPYISEHGFEKEDFKKMG